MIKIRPQSFIELKNQIFPQKSNFIFKNIVSQDILNTEETGKLQNAWIFSMQQPTEDMK